VRYTVFGAGSVGTVLAGLLASRAIPVSIAGRNAVGELHLEGDDETIHVQVPVVSEPVGTILLCVHESDVAELAPRFERQTVVTFSNGVTAERVAAEHCNVIGGIWRMTCTLLTPGRALFTRRGRVVLQRSAVADDFFAAGFDVGQSDDIEADLWLKLLCNIGSTPNAIIRSADHTDPRFGALKADLVAEAWRTMRARGIAASSCDGRDASPEEEIERQRVTGPRRRPVYNDTWRSLQRGRKPKERYHRTIASLGTAPLNEAMDALLDEATAPECFALDEVARRLGWS
jgi:ketopantoate reductase